jgi:hypothetical protein
VSMRIVVCVGCGYQSWAGVGARRVGASCGCGRLDAVDEEETVQPLKGVQVELCYDAGCVECGSGDDFVMWVGAEGEKCGKAGNGRRVGCARATHDYGKNVELCTRPVLAHGIGEGGIFVVNHVCGVGDVVVRTVFTFSYLIFFSLRSVAGVRSCGRRISSKVRGAG